MGSVTRLADAGRVLGATAIPALPSAAAAGGKGVFRLDQLQRAPRLGLVHDGEGNAPPRPRALSATEEHGELRSEIDLSLREILEQHLRPGCPELDIRDDGWVRGKLDPRGLLRLLRRHNLLHCLQRDEETTFWFWASAREATDLADSTGYRLDPVDFAGNLRD